MEVEPPTEITEIVEKARSLVGRECVTYTWMAYPETNSDRIKRVKLELSLLTIK